MQKHGWGDRYGALYVTNVTHQSIREVNEPNKRRLLSFSAVCEYLT